MEIIKTVERLVCIPSVTEREQEVLAEVCLLADEQGWRLEQIPVAKDRYNVLISFCDKPEIVLTTHLDTVPETSATRSFAEEGGRLYGRGSLDAKGIAACMLVAAKKLEEQGELNFALLFVVGEETDGAGAKTMARSFPSASFKYLVNGEPTENTLSRAQRGLICGTIEFAGRACHSAYPELGEDANAKLVRCASALMNAEWPTSELLGAASVNIGELRGGIASNVVSNAAALSFALRTVSEGAKLERQLLLENTKGYQINYEFDCDPVELYLLEGYETSVFKAGSDVPNFGQLSDKYLMYGPGDICLAHTDEESVAIEELEQAVDGYVDIVKKLSS